MNNKISDPYVICPVYETERFTLRQVQLVDAAGILDCYSDPEARLLFNGDNCRSDFRLSTLKDMREIIGSWLEEYQRRAYLRLSVIDKATGEAAAPRAAAGRISEDGTQW